MGYWLGIVFSCLDVLCVAVFCDAFLERKTRGLRFVVGALLCGVLSYIATVFVSHISEESPITLLKFAALITVYFVFASLLYTGKFWLRLLVVVLAYAISTLLEFCVLYSLLAWLHIRYDEYVANMKLYFASAAITYSLKFLLSSGIKKIHKPMVASSASIKWAPLTIGFPLISLVGISICYYLFPAHQDLLCRKGKSVYRSALRLSDKLHWPTVSAFCSTLAANRICRTTCNIGWQKQKVCCAFFSWMCRRASCTLSFPQTANSHSARPATAYRSYSAAPCGIPVSQPF